MIRIGAAGDQEPAVSVNAGELLHGLLHLLTPLECFGYFVQSVEQNQSALVHQFCIKIIGITLKLIWQLLDNKIPKRIVLYRSPSRRQIGGEIAQYDAHWQERFMRPALRLGFLFALLTVHR